MSDSEKNDKEMKQVGFEAEREVVERVKEDLEYGDLSEELRHRLQEIAYGTRTARKEQLREKLQSLREKDREILRDIQQSQEKRKEKQREIERVEQKLETLRDTEGEYAGALEMLEARLHDGERIHKKLDAVDHAADVGDTTREGVLEDLAERNPDVPNFAFELSVPHESFDWRDVDR